MFSGALAALSGKDEAMVAAYLLVGSATEVVLPTGFYTVCWLHLSCGQGVCVAQPGSEEPRWAWSTAPARACVGRELLGVPWATVRMSADVKLEWSTVSEMVL